nr:hypothetical protein [Tanacetum cinerariifolium]
MLESKAYKTYYAFASGEKTPKPKYVRKKVDSNTSPKQKLIQATKCTRLKTKAKVAKSDKKKQPTTMPKAKGLDVLSKVPDEQHFKTTGADEETGTIPGVLEVPIYESESEKESWGDSGEEYEDDENDFEDKSDGNDDDANDIDNDDANDDNNQEGDDTNEDDEETDSDRTESGGIKIPVLNQSSTEFYEEEEEKIDDEEKMDEEEDDEVTKELYDDANVNLGNEDTKMTNDDQAIVDRYIDNKLGEAIHKAIQSHNAECREEAQAEKQEYIDNVDSTRNVTESLEATVLTRSSSQLKLTGRDDKDKDRDPSARSNQGTKRRKSSKEAESSKDSRSKEISLQAPLKMPLNLNISLPASLPMQSQVILLKTQACNKIKSSSRETMMNNPLTKRLPNSTGSRNLRGLQLLILNGTRDNK